MVLATFKRPPNMEDPTNLQEVTQALATLKQKFNKAIFIVANDFNLPGIHWGSHIVTNNHFAYCVRGTVLNI